MKFFEKNLIALNGNDIAAKEEAAKEASPIFEPTTKRPLSPSHCRAKVHANYSHFKCSHPAKKHYGSLGYCGVHDPIKISERQKKTYEKQVEQFETSKAHYKARRALEDYQKACVELVEKLATGDDALAVIIAKAIVGLYEDSKK